MVGPPLCPAPRAYLSAATLTAPFGVVAFLKLVDIVALALWTLFEVDVNVFGCHDCMWG